MLSIPHLLNPILAGGMFQPVWLAAQSGGCIKGGGFPESCVMAIKKDSWGQ
jgi:hypothetical protein